ncbi:MAG: CoA transferase [Chloroflexi bacterium]|nr:CoA transferase [Chloroflexota bacterium]
MASKSAMESLLSSFNVLDLTTEKGCYFCSKILGDLGASVIRIEKPGVERDYWWLAYNDRKKLVYLDIGKEKDKLFQFAKEADFLVESFPPGYLDSLGLGYSVLKALNPRLIMTSITPFGQTGPYRDLKASDLEIVAMSGVLYGMGDPDRPPVRISFPQAHLLASAEAAVGTMVALCQRELTGEGQQVDVSAQESVNGIISGGKQAVIGSTNKRIGGFHGSMPGIKLGGGEVKYHHPLNPLIWKCKDGYVAFLMHPGMRGAHSNRSLVKYMEADGTLPDIVRNIEWETLDLGQTSPEDLKRVWDAFANFFARHTRQELYQIALKERIEFFPSNTVKEILVEEQLEARAFWQQQAVPELGKTLRFPGPFARVSVSPLTDKTGVQLKAPPNNHRAPFNGVNVLDFSWVYTGPWITQWLATYGAQVVKVESSSHLDVGRRTGGYSFAAYNSGKKSLTLNLKHPRGKELVGRLVRWADVIVENFTPGTMQKLGLGYDELLKVNPRVVMLSASMFGADGPHAAQPGLGQHLTSLAGFDNLTGWPDRSPVSPNGAYTDRLACRIAAATLFSAIDHQRRTGKGCYIDLSQFEASLHFLTPLILEYQATGKLLSRMGNRSLTDAPHGVFPCLGEDRWCAISVSTDSEWRAFCRILGKPEWLNDSRFATLEARKRNEEELEKLIAERTAKFSSLEVMTRLQEAGVKAAMVADWRDLLEDPQLNHRRHFVPVKHAQLGEYDYSGSGFRLEKANVVISPAPLFGEHNKYVCTQILGMPESEFDTLLNSGVLQ